MDLLDNEQVRRIAAFPNAVSLGDGAYLNYSDADTYSSIHPGLGAHLTTRFQQPLPNLREPNFHSDHCYRWGHIISDLLWTDPGSLNVPVTAGAFYLSDLAWLIDRRVYDGATLAFSAKGGHNDEPHNHNDLGHFILHLGGESLLADLGTGVYTRQYFSPQRYESPHTGSHGHSVPLINGQPQRAGRAHTATVLDHQQEDDLAIFTLDLTQAYADIGLESFTRSFNWSVDSASRSATLHLTDTFSFDDPPTALEECFISLRLPEVAEGRATWRGERGTITMQFTADLFEPFVDSIATQAHLGEPFAAYRLRLQAFAPALRQEYMFVFTCRFS